MKNLPRPRRSAALCAALAALATTATLATALPASTAEPAAVDGASSASAAASCWEIKQTSPSAPSGVYWLLTPAMAAPEQFYCDQTTDGGGWVLIGRGREGWKELYEGVGTPAQVRGTVTGTGAFTPRQLPSDLVDGLLNGQAPDELEDGVRLRRALDKTGSEWQEVRYRTDNQPRWSWALGSATPVTSGSFGTTAFTGGRTASFGTDQTYSRVVTSEAEAQAWTQGFAYGSQARGENSASTYIWSNTATAGNPRPFTQIYLRPKLTQANAGFTALPASGTPGNTQQARPETGAVPTSWGVTGLANGSGELNSEVQAFAQIGNTVYVAGNFRYVQKDSAGTGRVEQSYLAGFDVNTGEWISGFRPNLNGQVKALAVLPNGTLAIGGTFSTLNGQPAGAVTAIDPVSGAAAPGWRLGVENRVSGGAVQIRSLEVREGWLYVGGAFTHLTGATGNPVYARSAARVAAATGQPDGTWNPAFNGTVVDVDPSADGQRLYAAGYFSTSNTANTYRAAAIGTGAGASVVPWDFVPSSGDRAGYQQGIEEVGNRVWVGGAEHSLFSFDTATLTRQSTNITLSGGDFQDVSAANGIVYGSCHCGHWNYSGASTWPSVGSNFQMADKINLIGAWDAGTGEYIPGFNPVMKGRAGYGIWSAFVDSRGILWAGGDLVSSVSSAGRNQWSGGYARFAPADATAPSTPDGFTVSSAGGNDTLRWSAAAGSPALYHVLRNDRVVATTTATTFSLPAVAGARYYVRAADAAGNFSATTAAAGSTGVVPPAPQALIPAGSQWKYRFSGEAPPTGWTGTAFNDAGWSTGTAALGWGTTNLGTTLTASGTKPLSSHYRKTVQVPDPSQLASVTLTTRADDGVVVYVNGVEVARANMPAGTPNHNTYATAAPSTAAAVAAPVVVTVPGSAFTAGTNVISAEVHSNYRSTPSASFDLTASMNLHR
ncbi:fibrinogen-like YCDxxxxGGGW domain-containing protein [Arthrobacter sp. zg-Y179]|uniref:fibrinogen-like YCDxxxxGGGW domain-containing protein n=1 Tax=Arthrobacter sp. zg-Y179 TaxID=2894188 RepID=UPI001E42547B|nr:fibrinogen-like YCDxxxxGGGW domain-containing protein [Arthrobacter sp. zg-Y179]MCC9175200.1 fibrinogen [Arthrobacter sp. zg-Y179]